jgi:hypothetical protein
MPARRRPARRPHAPARPHAATRRAVGAPAASHGGGRAPVAAAWGPVQRPQVAVAIAHATLLRRRAAAWAAYRGQRDCGRHAWRQCVAGCWWRPATCKHTQTAAVAARAAAKGQRLCSTVVAMHGRAATPTPSKCLPTTCEVLRPEWTKRDGCRLLQHQRQLQEPAAVGWKCMEGLFQSMLLRVAVPRCQPLHSYTSMADCCCCCCCRCCCLCCSPCHSSP